MPNPCSQIPPDRAAVLAATLVTRELGEEHNAHREARTVEFAAVLPDRRAHHFRATIEEVD